MKLRQQLANRHRLRCLVPIAAFGLVYAQAQQSTTTTVDSTGTSTTTSGSAATTTTGTTGAGTAVPRVTDSTTGTGSTRPIFLSGTVMMDDGSALPENVSIQSICAGLRRTMARASATGSFAFQWTSTGRSFGDASQTIRMSGSTGAGSLTGTRNGSRGLDPLANCDLLAEYAGYSSTRVSLYNRAGEDNYDVGMIVLHRIMAGEGHTVSVLALKAPKEAKKSFERGTTLAAANKLPEAIASFESAVAAYPAYADAWLSTGKVQWRMGAKDSARTSFQKALDLDAKLLGPWQELGFLACDEARWEDAVRFLGQAARLDPIDSPNVWYYSALANYNLERFDQAERSVRAEIRLDRGKNPREDLLLGLILIARKDYDGGAAALRNYLAAAPRSEEAALAQKQLSRIVDSAGQ